VSENDPRNDARSLVERWRAEGLLPAEPPPEVVARIAGVLRQHHAEQEDRRPGRRRKRKP
jgi:hypothetical protein